MVNHFKYFSLFSPPRLVAMFDVKSIIYRLIYTHLQVNLTTLSIERFSQSKSSFRARIFKVRIRKGHEAKEKDIKKNGLEWLILFFLILRVLSRSRWLRSRFVRGNHLQGMDLLLSQNKCSSRHLLPKANSDVQIRTYSITRKKHGWWTNDCW